MVGMITVILNGVAAKRLADQWAAAPAGSQPRVWHGRGVVGLLAALALVGCGTGGSAPDLPAPSAPSATRAVAPPAQPTKGPGGKQRWHVGVQTTEVGGSPGSVTIFEPQEPTPRSAPVVVFTQGVGPEQYQGWIDHLVGRGSIVVFQNQPFQVADLAERRKGPLAGLRAVVRELKRPGHVTPQWDRLVLVGHSVGGNMAAQLAADTGKQRLPRPKTVFAVQPRPEDEASIRVLRGIEPSSLVLVLASDRDDRVGVEGPKALWAALGHIPAANKDYVLVRSDEHGTPALVADHLLPLSSASNPPDALDFYAPWKLLDGLQRCAIARQDCRVALGATAEQRFMGRWSDGVPVTPLQVTDSP
jgi:dienelactone hydrolase